MRARFIKGEHGKLGVEFIAETSDECLLLEVFDRQMSPTNILHVQSWRYAEVQEAFAMQTMRCYIATNDSAAQRNATSVPDRSTDQGDTPAVGG